MSPPPSEKARPLRVSFIFEYARPADDWMMRSLIESLRSNLKGLEATCIHGLFGTYQPGGLRPKRLANLVWVYLRTAVELVIRRPDAVLVRSSPPGIQLWTALWARLRGVPVLCWLMDYHPEIEARGLERKGLGTAARLIRALDASTLRQFAAVITLDRAMAQTVRARANDVEILEHPTWGADSRQAPCLVSYPPGEGQGPVRLAYSGNLGAAHSLAPFEAFLKELVGHRPVQLHVVGASPAGIESFRALGTRLNIPIVVRPRVPFQQLGALYNEWRIDAGVVLLDEASAGLLSPSKFSGYIHFGIPLVYLGPPDTNSADVCTRFNGGFWLPSQAPREVIVATAAALLDRNRMALAAAGARAAARHFASFDHDSLAAWIAPRLRRSAPA